MQSHKHSAQGSLRCWKNVDYICHSWGDEGWEKEKACTKLIQVQPYRLYTSSSQPSGTAYSSAPLLTSRLLRTLHRRQHPRSTTWLQTQTGSTNLSSSRTRGLARCRRRTPRPRVSDNCRPPPTCFCPFGWAHLPPPLELSEHANQRVCLGLKALAMRGMQVRVALGCACRCVG